MRGLTKGGRMAWKAGLASVIADYAHYPVESGAGLAAAREGATGRVVAVVQPHRFTRLRDLMEDFRSAFNDADTVYVTPVYPAGEAPIDGIDAAALVTGLKQRGHRAAMETSGPDDLATRLAETLPQDDTVICLGAGAVTKWAAGLDDAGNLRRAVGCRAWPPCAPAISPPPPL